jgi:hypothetical protein
MDKSNTLKAFNTLFFLFLDDIIGIFPEKTDLVVSKTSFETIKRLNVSAIVKAWFYFVYTPYKDKIMEGDISFFIDKDYNEDLSLLSNSRDIMAVIDNIRGPIREMSEANKAHSLNYMQKLSQLSEMYMGFAGV